MSTMLTTKINITRCVIAWSLKNVRKDINDSITVDSVEINIPDGYYSFSDAKKLLATHKITIEKLPNNHITVESPKDVNLKKLGSSLLGFDEKNLVKDTKHKSTYSASMTNKIKDIHVYCNLVDASRNYAYSLNNNVYNMSTQLLMIPIDTTQQLNGNFTEYNISGINVPCRDDITTQEVDFAVESGGHSLDYEIFLTLELK